MFCGQAGRLPGGRKQDNVTPRIEIFLFFFWPEGRVMVYTDYGGMSNLASGAKKITDHSKHNSASPSSLLRGL